MKFPAPHDTPHVSDDEMEVINNSMNSVISEFGSINSRIQVDSDSNKEFLMGSLDSFSEYFRSSFGVNSDEIRTKFGQTSLFVLMLITIDNTATAKTMSDILDVSQRTIENHLAKLKEEEIIMRKGSDKSGYYQINRVK